MIKYTTPIITLHIKNVDLTQADKVLVTIKQDANVIETEELDITCTEESGVTVTTIKFNLEQEDTANMNCFGKIQVNWLYTEDGVQLRDATVAKTIKFGEQLHPSVWGEEE